MGTTPAKKIDIENKNPVSQKEKKLKTGKEENDLSGIPLDKIVPSTLEPPETYTQFGQTYNIYYRETLYKEVWEYPFTELSKKYQVSDVTIRKICKTLNIPTPPAGHWAKLRAGKPVKKIALPKSTGTDKTTGVRTGAEYRSSQNLQHDRKELAFSVDISEAKDQITHVITKEEHMQLLKYEDDKKQYSWASKPQIRKYEQIFSGRICLRFDTVREFRDRKSNVIEERLGDMAIALFQAAEEVRKKREEREEAERKRREEEKRKEEFRKSYNTEVARTLSLINEASDYEIACKIRRYVAAIEASGEPDEKVLDWINWATSKADWLDPVIDKEDAILGKRKHDEAEDKKQLKQKGYY
jgi:hypothetical protein